MTELVKVSLKLLLRNKGFLFFLIVTPILSTFILSMKMEHSVYSDAPEQPVIVELKNATDD